MKIENIKLHIRPKRRKAKDNPYTLKHTITDTYKVSFKDVFGNYQEIEISKEVYKEMDKWELEDKHQMNQYDNHIEHMYLSDDEINRRQANKECELEDLVIEQLTFEEIRNAVNKLPDIQKRRIVKYYFENKTQRQIAEEENVDIRAVQYSLRIALRNLKQFLKNI